METFEASYRIDSISYFVKYCVIILYGAATQSVLRKQTEKTLTLWDGILVKLAVDREITFGREIVVTSLFFSSHNKIFLP